MIAKVEKNAYVYPAILSQCLSFTSEKKPQQTLKNNSPVSAGFHKAQRKHRLDELQKGPVPLSDLGTVKNAIKTETHDRWKNLQPKLKVTSSNDMYEREADRITDKVISSSAKSNSSLACDQSSSTTTALSLQSRKTPSTPMAISRKSGGSSSAGANISSSSASTISDVLSSSLGTPLKDSMKQKMEKEFGYDFSMVRIHDDSRAAKSAQSVNALAYTVGNHVVFDEGQYHPETSEGKRLLTHELTHVIQQSEQPVGSVQDNLHPISARTSSDAMVQRQGSDSDIENPGNAYEIKVDRKGERASFSLRFAVSKSKTSPLTAKGDIADKNSAEGNVKGQVLESKVSLNKSRGEKWGFALSMAVAKGDLTAFEICPGITIKADLKAFDAKLEKGQIDVNVFKVGVAIEGTINKDNAHYVLGKGPLREVLSEDLSIKVSGKIEVNVDPHDVVKLVEMAKKSHEMAKEAADAVKAKRKLDALERENKKIRTLLKRGGKLSEAARRKLKGRLARNASKIGKLQKGLNASKKAVVAMRAAYQAAAKGLKSKAGRLMGMAVAKVGAKVLARFIPGLNIALAVYDIVDAIPKLYALITGKAELGFGGEEEGGGSSADAETSEGGEEASEEGEGPGSSSGGTEMGDSSSEGIGDAGLGPEVSVDEELASLGKTEKKPPLHKNADKLFKLINAQPGTKGVQLSASEMEQLNQIVPSDLTEEEIRSLAERLQAGIPSKDSLDVLGAILEGVQELKDPDPDKEQGDGEPSSGSGQVTDADKSGAETKQGAEGKKSKSEKGGETESKAKGKSAEGPIFSRARPYEGTASKTVAGEFTYVSGFSPNVKSSQSLRISFERDDQKYTSEVKFIIKSREATKAGTTIFTLESTNNSNLNLAPTGVSEFVIEPRTKLVIEFSKK
jgi:Domain of unknown function (DUF4157)